MDDDATRVHEFLVEGVVGLPGDTQVGAHVLVDVISSASVDVVSAASVDVVSAASVRLREDRAELGVHGSWYVTPEVDVTVAATRSSDSDWLAYSPALSAGADLFQRNTRIALGYGFVYNEVRKSNDPRFEQVLDIHALQAGLTQLLDERTVVGVAYAFQAALGWLSNPYRYVRLTDGATLSESHPSERLRHAVTFHGVRYLGAGVALAASYRIYRDGWGITANTASSELRIEVDPEWELRLRARGYTQSSADFWRQAYHGAPTLRSADAELSTLWDVGGGLKATWRSGAWMVDLKAETFYYRYLDYAPLSSRVALVADMGTGYAW